MKNQTNKPIQIIHLNKEFLFRSFQLFLTKQWCMAPAPEITIMQMDKAWECLQWRRPLYPEVTMEGVDRVWECPQWLPAIYPEVTTEEVDKEWGCLPVLSLIRACLSQCFQLVCRITREVFRTVCLKETQECHHLEVHLPWKKDQIGRHLIWRCCQCRVKRNYLHPWAGLCQ